MEKLSPVLCHAIVPPNGRFMNYNAGQELETDDARPKVKCMLPVIHYPKLSFFTESQNF